MKGKTQEKIGRGSRKRSSSAGGEKMERVGGRQEKNGRMLFDRPKPSVGCSANGRRRRRRRRSNYEAPYSTEFSSGFSSSLSTAVLPAS